VLVRFNGHFLLMRIALGEKMQTQRCCQPSCVDFPSVSAYRSGSIKPIEIDISLQIAIDRFCRRLDPVVAAGVLSFVSEGSLSYGADPGCNSKLSLLLMTRHYQS
jgi:hypothetical protein